MTKEGKYIVYMKFIKPVKIDDMYTTITIFSRNLSLLKSSEFT